jgi:hypothetical protein
VGQPREVLEAEGSVQGSHVHDHAAAGLQVQPRRTGEVEHQVDFIPAGGIPVLVGEAFEPVEVGLSREVEQDVDPAERAHRQLGESRALGRIVEVTRMQ